MTSVPKLMYITTGTLWLMVTSFGVVHFLHVFECYLEGTDVGSTSSIADTDANQWWSHPHTYYHTLLVSYKRKASVMRLRKQSCLTLVSSGTPQVRGRKIEIMSRNLTACMMTVAQAVSKPRDLACPQPQVKSFPDQSIVVDQLKRSW